MHRLPATPLNDDFDTTNVAYKRSGADKHPGKQQGNDMAKKLV